MLHKRNEDRLYDTYKRLHINVMCDNLVVDKTGVAVTELINVTIKDLDPTQPVLDFNCRKTPIKYVKKESDWYNSMSLNIKGYVDDIKIWNEVADKHGFVNSNYGWCIYSKENHKQYINCLSTLNNNKLSRRATMIYIRPSMQYEYNRDGMSDFMCTYSTQQFIRRNKLIYIVNQRSQDMIYGLFNDFAWHQEVYMKLYNDLKNTYPTLEIGTIELNIGSAHVYERHFQMLKKIIEINRQVK